MAAQLKLQNNFKNYQADFKADTGLTVNKETMNLYLQYFSARASDNAFQSIVWLGQNIVNDLNHLPSTIALRIGEMMNNSSTVKELLKKRS